MAGPVLTLDVTGNPRVEVFFDPGSLLADTASLRMYRYSDGRTWLIRGGVDVAPGVAALDFEVPFRSQATYRAEMFDSTGVSLGFTDSTSITLDVDGTWVHQPLQPLLAARLSNLSGSAETLVRATPGEMVYPEGASAGRRIGSRRRALEGVPVLLLAETIDAADSLQTMLGSYAVEQVPVLCIRTSEQIRWPRTFFASTVELVERELTVHLGGSLIRFEASMDEVEPPFPGLVTPLLTYDDLDAYYSTYTAMDAAYPTYTARDRDYSLAGFADQ